MHYAMQKLSTNYNLCIIPTLYHAEIKHELYLFTKRVSRIMQKLWFFKKTLDAPNNHIFGRGSAASNEQSLLIFNLH